MATKLRVPSQHVRPLSDLAQLSEAEHKALARAVAVEAPAASLELAASRLAESTGFDPAKAERIFDLLVSLHVAREDSGLSPEEFVSELRHAMEAAGSRLLTPKDWGAFEGCLQTLLAPDSALALTAKAIAVVNEHANVFLRCRVLTDLRPVFGSEVEDAPASLVTIHTLKLTYRGNRSTSDVFMALDRADIVDLMDTLGRALKKEDSLTRLANDKSLTIMEVKR
jgi:hypothetical protein